MFYLIKIIRLAKGFKILDEHVIMGKIKIIYREKILEKMKNDHLGVVANDKVHDHNKIQELLIIYYVLKITKLVIIILNFSYLFGMFWYIMIKFVEDVSGYDYDNPEHSAENERTFIVYYGLQ